MAQEEKSSPGEAWVPIPDGFTDTEALRRLAHLVATLLLSGMPERELAKRLTRYHPAQEG